MKLPEDFSPGRVLLIRPRGLGDVVLSSVAVDALRRAWPDAALDYLSSRPAAELLHADRRLDRVHLLEDFAGTARAVRWARERTPDLVLDLFSNPRTALITAFSGASYRAGLDKRIRRFAYNVRVPRFRGPPETDHRYAQDVQTDFLRAAGVRWEGRARASLELTEDERAAADSTLGELGLQADREFGALLPGGSWASKRWTEEGYVACGRALSSRLGRPALVVWGPGEEEAAARIAGRLGDAGRLAPATTIRGMAALLARCAVLVSTDCLGRHLAIVQDIPTVGVFGPTDPRDWTPREGPHRTVCREPLTALEPDPVVAALAALLREVDARGAGP